MKTKKTIIAVLAAALVTAFFIGCSVPLDNLNLDIGQTQSTHNGKARVRINLGNSNSNARTILPDTSDYTSASSFAGFVLFIYSVTETDYLELPASTPITSPDPTDSSSFVYIPYSALATDLELDPDNKYIFTIFACNELDGTGEFQAWGISDDGNGDPEILITGTDDEVNIALKEIIGSIPTAWNSFISNGKFSWDFTDDKLDLSNYTTAILTLTEIGGSTALDIGGLNVKSVDIKTTKTSTVSNVPVGYYRMVLQLGNIPEFQTVYVREVIHIWSGLETKYIPEPAEGATAAALPTLRSLRHTVTFDYSDDSQSPPSPKTAIHGNTINDVLASGTDNTAPDPTNTTDNYFSQWFYTNSSGNVAKLTDVIIKPITLYAKWLPYNTPDASQYNVGTNLSQVEGSVSAVSVTVNSSLGAGNYSPGAVTVYYEGKTPTNYTRQIAVPQVAGQYFVTFDVAASSVSDTEKWKAATDLDTGKILVVNEAPKIFNITFAWGILPSTNPIFDDSSCSFDPDSGKLIIDIMINNKSWGTCEWTSDHILAALESEDDTDDFHLLLTLQDFTESIDWVTPGTFTIEVLLDGQYDGVFTFTCADWE